MKKHKHTLKIFACLLSLTMLVTTVACGSSQKTGETTETETAESENAEDDTAATAEETTEAAAEKTDMDQVVDAMQATADQKAFSIDNAIEIQLNGSLVSGDYHLKSDVQVLRGDSDADLQMKASSSSDIDDIVTKIWYKDGIYATDNGTDTTIEEKSPEEVWSQVADITDLVKDAAGTVEEMQVDEKEDGITEYSYEVPDYLARDYVLEVLDRLQLEALDGALISVDQASFVTDVKDDQVQTQYVTLIGEVHVAILSFPVQVDIQADFAPMDAENLDMSDMPE